MDLMTSNFQPIRSIPLRFEHFILQINPNAAVNSRMKRTYWWRARGHKELSRNSDTRCNQIRIRITFMSKSTSATIIIPLHYYNYNKTNKNIARQQCSRFLFHPIHRVFICLICIKSCSILLTITALFYPLSPSIYTSHSFIYSIFIEYPHIYL